MNNDTPQNFELSPSEGKDKSTVVRLTLSEFSKIKNLSNLEHRSHTNMVKVLVLEALAARLARNP